MPFRWFQKHNKAFLYFVALFIMPTFLIGAGAFYVFGNIGRNEPVASYEIVPGNTQYLYPREATDFARRYRSQNIIALASVEAKLEEAKLAGIHVSDAEVLDSIRQELLQVFPQGYTQAQYKGVVGQMGLTIRQYENTVRERLTIARLESLKALKGQWVSSKDVYDAWADEHQELTYEYVDFPAEDLRDDYDIFSFEPDEVKQFYEKVQGNPELYAWAVDDYRIPQRFDMEVLFVEFADVTPETNPQLFEDAEEPTDDDLRAYYEANLAAFLPEDEGSAGEGGDDDASSDDGSEEDEGDDGSEDDEGDDASAAEPAPFDEVKDEIRERWIVRRAFDRLYEELLAKQEAGERIDFETIAGERDVLYYTVDEMDAEALAADSILGYEDIGVDLPLVAPGELSRSVVDANPDSVYVYRVTRVRPPDFKSQQQIDLELREDMITEKVRQEAEKKPREIFDEMEAWIEKRIREDNGETVEDDDADSGDEDKDEAEADEDASEGEDSAEEEADDEPPTEAETLSEAQLQEAKRARISEAWLPILEKRELEPKMIGPAEFLRRGTDEYENEEDPTRKFLLAYAALRTQDEGRILPIYDRANHVGYLVRVVAKSKPDPSEMPADAFDEYHERELFSGFRMGSSLAQIREQQWIGDIKLRERGRAAASGGAGTPPAGGGAPPSGR